jgi:hypothetical protein
MPPENRRTFVKKSVATSVSISFVGLIRAAHGEETTGTTTTTYDPQQTTSPTSGQTTTFDPQQTTTVQTTTPPNTTTVQTYDSDVDHLWVTRIKVTYTVGTKQTDATDPGKGAWSGRVYSGILEYWFKVCYNNGFISEEITADACAIKSGGYIYITNGVVGSHLLHSPNYADDDERDTCWAPGDYKVSTQFTSLGSNTAGYLGGDPNADGRYGNQTNKRIRTDMKLHFLASRHGSAGCIVFTDQSQFSLFCSRMNKTHAGPNHTNHTECKEYGTVPMEVRLGDDIVSV